MTAVDIDEGNRGSAVHDAEELLLDETCIRRLLSEQFPHLAECGAFLIEIQWFTRLHVEVFGVKQFKSRKGEPGLATQGLVQPSARVLMILWIGEEVVERWKPFATYPDFVGDLNHSSSAELITQNT